MAIIVRIEKVRAVQRLFGKYPPTDAQFIKRALLRRNVAAMLTDDETMTLMHLLEVEAA